MSEGYPLLAAIDGPADLKRLRPEQLPQLAAEMRRFMIRTLAPIGGHLGAGLGVVELTIALHYLFDSPRDRIVWDVGHQAYPHKILTGRRRRLATIRQKGGLSGFTKRSESEHDPFGAGHASTSISAAYGMAVARQLDGEEGHDIAVIGDGALTGGMALEALNHAGGGERDLIVILNDNEMSIAPNVGALSSYLARIISGSAYGQIKDGARRLLSALPGALEAARRVEEHVKGLITPGTLFEEMGFRYIGPLDGHDFDHLLPTLANVRQLRGPVLLHVLTRKGLGFGPAEEDPVTWHGLGPYDPERGTPIAAAACLTYTRVFAEELCALAEADPRIVAITAAMPGGTGLSAFAERFPDRFFDVGIAEQHAVTFACGLAVGGKRPVVAIYSTFMQRAYDQIIHDLCIQQLPVVLCMDRAGVVGADGPTHTGMFDIAYLRCLPKMTVMAPRSGAELRAMLRFALTLDGPAALRYPRAAVDAEAEEPAPAPIALGRAEVIARGGDGLLVAVGTRCADARAALREAGVSMSLLNLRFVKPLDRRTILDLLVEGKPLVVVEEGCAQGGVGEAIAALALASGWRGPFAHMAMPDRFPDQGRPEEVLAELELDRASIAARLRALVQAGDDTATSKGEDER
ncbi:MAG: 1-deoxy-D-xylulose-5-phosphate synthase [Zetaproteobacteria bacterium]|nr:MAG: 1-deoxy-D-xylulose-5-phosphate synthase [Zetaproteobacteria bacterium]